jgi:hypothetical protein|mmetsp:Transcript_111382/g.175535  ORF Transcript_111382/g.175535 Transcript_111382/m.175535 type:complete len:297 (-) Transcript_111382:42-932(-)
MKVVTLGFVALLWPVGVADVLQSEAPRHTLLQLQRDASGKPPMFAGPKQEEAVLNLQGFCKRPDNKPACDAKPCCCWSTWAAPLHPDYESGETASKQTCENPPDGFVYAPEPGLSYDDGYFDTLKKQSLPVYDGRRLCCLRRAQGVQVASQRDLSAAVKTITSTTTIGIAGAGAGGDAQNTGIDVPAQFTTETFTTSVLVPGDEYETAQMEEAARAHLQAATDLKEAVGSLTNSAAAIDAVNTKLQTDPNLVRSRKHVAEMRAAINAWVNQRWQNLKKLEAGDASAFAPAGAPASI